MGQMLAVLHPQPPGPGLLPEPTTNGKLAALGMCVARHMRVINWPVIPIIPFTFTPLPLLSVCACRVKYVGDKPISFLLDTGAAVTLIGSDVWRRVNIKQLTKLEPWSD